MLSHDELVDEVKTLEQVITERDAEIKQLEGQVDYDRTYLKDLKERYEQIREIVKRHNGSDSHARKLFDEIEEKFEDK